MPTDPILNCFCSNSLIWGLTLLDCKVILGNATLGLGSCFNGFKGGGRDTVFGFSEITTFCSDFPIWLIDLAGFGIGKLTKSASSCGVRLKGVGKSRPILEEMVKIDNFFKGISNLI